MTAAARLPVALASIGSDAPSYAIVRAAGIVTIVLPIVVVVLLVQKYIVGGLTFGAGKRIVVVGCDEYKRMSHRYQENDQ